VLSERGGWQQVGYEVAVDAGRGWRIEAVAGSGSVLEPWPFEPLASRQQVRRP
jgi:hypothetical protein